MDTGISILGVVVLALFILPFVIIRRNRKQTERKFLQALSTLAEKSNCSISEYETWNNRYAIGIDKGAHKVFFVGKKDNNDNVENEVDLSLVQNSRVINTNRSIRNGKESYQVIEQLELCFDFTDNSLPRKTLMFYNAKHESLTVAGELQLAEKWAQIVNSVIASRKIKK